MNRAPEFIKKREQDENQGPQTCARLRWFPLFTAVVCVRAIVDAAVPTKGMTKRDLATQNGITVMCFSLVWSEGAANIYVCMAVWACSRAIIIGDSA